MKISIDPTGSINPQTLRKPSRFLEDIPRHLVSSPTWWEGEGQVAEFAYNWNHPSKLRELPKTRQSIVANVDLPELSAGDHVIHPQFGEGVVVSSREVSGDSEIVVAFEGMGVKKLLLSLAKLEKV